MEHTVLKEEFIDGCLELILNRPNKLNALNLELYRALRSALENSATNQECRVVLLTGAGRGFSVSQDLGERDPMLSKEP